MKKIIAVLLVLTTLVGTMSSCSGAFKNSYLAKGEFFSLVMSEMNYYPIDAEWEDMQDDDEFTIASKSMVDWELLNDEEAYDKVKKPVTKEIALVVLANSLSIPPEGTTDGIKDISMSEYPDEIATAVAAGIAETDDNGYLNLNQKLTYDDCVDLVEKRNYAESNTHVDEKDFCFDYDFGKDSSVLSFSDIPEGDYIDVVGYEEANEAVNESTSTTSTETFEKPETQFLGLTTNAIPTMPTDLYSFVVYVSKDVYDVIFKNESPSVGFYVVYDATRQSNSDDQSSACRYYTTSDYVAGNTYEEDGTRSFAGCLLQLPELVNTANGERYMLKMKAIDDQEKMAHTDATVYEPLKHLDFSGKQLTFDGLSITPTLDSESGSFTVEVKKQLSQSISVNPNNAAEVNKYNATLTYTYTVSNLAADISNIKYLFRSDSPKKGTPLARVSWDTNEEIKFETDKMDLTPYDNGNGKGLTNLKNALKRGLKSTESSGSNAIKLYDFSCVIPEVGVTVVFYVLLTFEVDGSFKITISRADNGFQFVKKGRNITCEKLQVKDEKKEVNLNVNFNAQLEIEATMLFALTLKRPVVTAYAGVSFAGTAAMNLYDENDNKDEESITGGDNSIVEQLQGSGQSWKYCIDIHGQFSLVGGIKDKPAIASKKFNGKDSVLYWVLSDIFGVNMSKLIFKIPIGNELGFHFEDGSFVDSCTRSKKDEDEEQSELDAEAKKQGNFLVESTKETVMSRSTVSDKITGWPISEKKIESDYKGGVVVSVKDDDICDAWYDADNKTVMIYGKNVGSTEIEVYIHKYSGILFFKTEKQYYKQTISVTVDSYDTGN